MATTTLTSNWLAQDREQAAKDFLAQPEPQKTVGETWRKTPFAPFALERGLPPFVVLGGDLEDAANQPEVRAQLEAFWSGPEYRKLELANRAGWRGGRFVFVPAGKKVEAPIRVTFDAPAGSTVFPRLLVILGDGAEATIVEEHKGAAALSIAYSKVVLGKGARARVSYLQEYGPETRHFWSQKVELAQDAQLIHAALTLGAKLHKTDLAIDLAGSGARSELFGMTLGDGSQHFDSFTKQWHRAPRTYSDLLFRTALRQKSKAVYNGLIRIEPEARGTEAFQSNHNLLLSKQARADATPILEILTDEVACKHAATAGQLDKDELFYLETRGMDEREATRMLVMGFFEPVLSRLPFEDERERLAGVIEARL